MRHCVFIIEDLPVVECSVSCVWVLVVDASVAMRTGAAFVCQEKNTEHVMFHLIGGSYL